MPYLILGRNPDPKCPHYRGTDRVVPHFREDLPEDHEVNRAFFRYLKTLDGSSISTLSEAQRIAATLNEFVSDTPFEVIEVVFPGQAFTSPGEFLGYDIACDLGLSYLSNCFWKAEQVIEDDRKKLTLLNTLLSEYCELVLNTYGLFSDENDAVFCFQGIKAMNRLQVNLWDDPAKYEIVKLQVVIAECL